MSLALYRKYRPATFSDVVGQQAIVDTLRRQVASGRVAHAYLFTGSRGTGKTSCAKILAKAVNCLDPKEGDPCGLCACCRGVEDDSLTDVSEIDAASNNGVDFIRELREEAFFTPAMARYRVYIIDEVHMLSPSAFNALLKIMEEPPAHVIFILSTTEIHKVLPTIISRCQRFDFKRIDSSIIAQRLLHIAKLEGIELTEDGAMQIARLSDGALRDALSLLDVCRARGVVVDADAVANAVGLMGDDHLFELAGYLLRRQVAEAIGLIGRMAQGSLEPMRLCEQLIGHMRSLMLVKTVDNPLPLIGCMPDRLPLYRQQAAEGKLRDILRCLSELGLALTAISRTTAKRMELEAALVRICAPAPDGVSEDSNLAERVARLEQLMATAGAQHPAAPAPPWETPVPPTTSAKPAPTPPSEQTVPPPVPPEAPVSDPPPWEAQTPPQPPEKPTPEQAEKAPDPGPNPEGLQPFEAWPQVLLRLESINRMNAGLLRGSKAYLSGRRVLIDCKDPVFLNMMRTTKETRAHIKKAIYLTTGQNMGIGPYRRESEEKSADPLSEFIEGLEPHESIIIK